MGKEENTVKICTYDLQDLERVKLNKALLKKKITYQTRIRQRYDSTGSTINTIEYYVDAADAVEVEIILQNLSSSKKLSMNIDKPVLVILLFFIIAMSLEFCGHKPMHIL